MSLVFAGVCSHAPGITGRPHLAEAGVCKAFHDAFYGLGKAMRAARPDALVLVGAEHFGNFFMNNMPAFAMGMAEYYDGPIEDSKWIGIPQTRVPGSPELSQRLIQEVMQSSDVSYAEEWKLDHGFIVPLNFLTPEYDLDIIPVNINCQGPPLAPLHRAWAFGEALRRAADSVPERIAIIGTGGISHWPCTPDSGRINEAWDQEFMDRWISNDKDALLSYTDPEIYRDAGQGGFEIRTYISVAAAARGRGEVQFFESIPIFSVTGTVATMTIEA